MSHIHGAPEREAGAAAGSPLPWGSRQPGFERLERDGAGRWISRVPTGQETRVELGPTPRLDRGPEAHDPGD